MIVVGKAEAGGWQLIVGLVEFRYLGGCAGGEGVHPAGV